jgi:hypothetical protein
VYFAGFGNFFKTGLAEFTEVGNMNDMGNTVTRCVTLPVRSCGENVSILDTFRRPWRLATDLANWCQRELALHDPGLRQPDHDKMLKYEPKAFNGRSLYAHVTANCPFRSEFDGAAGSMGAIIKHVEDAWRKHPKFGRFSVLWKGEAAPCVFRFAFPWPVRSQELRILRGKNDEPQAVITLPGGRVVAALASGKEFYRQSKQFDILLADLSRLKQAKVCARFRCGKLVGVDIRLVGSFDVNEATGDNAAEIHTDANALLIARVSGHQPWIINADHLRRWQEQHRVFLQRSGEDMKREKRMTPQQRKNLQKAIELRCVKHHARMDTGIKQIAAQLVRFCERQRVGCVAYNDTIREYFPDGFQWANLESIMRAKLAEFGVKWISTDGTDEKNGKNTQGA